MGHPGVGFIAPLDEPVDAVLRTLPPVSDPHAAAWLNISKPAFLPPLHSWPQVKDVDERQGALPGSARLALQCLDIKDPTLVRVFKGIVG